MGRNSMEVSSIVGGVEQHRRVTRLHGLNRPLRFDVELFSTAFLEAAKLLEGLDSLKVETTKENLGLPTFVLNVMDADGDTYKLTGMHTMGFYMCCRGDGKSYKMTELLPKIIARKIKKYFVLD